MKSQKKDVPVHLEIFANLMQCDHVSSIPQMNLVALGGKILEENERLRNDYIRN